MRERSGGKINLAYLFLLGIIVSAMTVSCSRGPTDTIEHGRFRKVSVYAPAGHVRQVILFLSGDGGWQADTDRMARVLQQHGALVLGIDEPALLASFTAEHSECFFADGDLENLSHYIQAYYHLPTYITPVLGGYSAGATLAYATAAQAPPGLFAGVVTLGFTPDYETSRPFCKGEGTHFVRRAGGKGLTLLPDPKFALRWVDVHGSADTVCPAEDAAAFIRRIHNAQISLIPDVQHDFAHPPQWSAQLTAALDAVTAGVPLRQPVAPLTLKDLPLIEVPQTANGNEDLFAVLLSGDGGWAGIDKQVARALAERGIPVVGWDTLRYFWTPRTPAGVAHDLDRTLQYYARAWNRRHVLLIGYSQGADVLPFAVNRLPEATRHMIQTTTLLGLGRNAAFEFHLANWVGPASGLPILPEYQRLSRANTVCVFGTGDKDSLCSDFAPGTPGIVELAGGHHFDGDYDGLARLILKFAGRDRGPEALDTSAPRSEFP
ncbi:MAG TPA: AcvB/VirJ family lysyl-phosphatidylglycerol hydrolase [Steroidobacteraceae bacterium]|nr:AcvB/VirJ family lysyl-phosphatidylglycerol hydrolase [Steroidobacteraceae bacterium]